jgi:hypothetical protein
MEFVGEVVSELLGFNTSKYQWVIDIVEKVRTALQHSAEFTFYSPFFSQSGGM